MNEDVKQTLLQATPWLRDAESEEEQMRAVANYLDSAAMRVRHGKLVADLAERQNADGGWAWMPEGKSSLWVTQAVLQKVKGEDLDTGKTALKYVDREEQRYYDRWIKPYLKKGIDCQPTNIDYLYMRSFYGKGATEAYKYYYANALKRYRDYEHLYTQAQLALIFQRAGDNQAGARPHPPPQGEEPHQRRDGHLLARQPLVLVVVPAPHRDPSPSYTGLQRGDPQDTAFIGQMQQWLLKQKQTTHWGNDEATVKAIDALMVGSGSGNTRDSRNSGFSRDSRFIVFGTEMTAQSRRPRGLPPAAVDGRRPRCASRQRQQRHRHQQA